jgi:hypothetical protein
MSPKEEPEVEDIPKEPTALAQPVVEALASVQKAVEELAALLGVDSTATIEALKKAGQTASDNLAGLAHGAKDIGDAKLDDLSAAVRRNPLAWLGAAVGLGLIVGLWRGRDGRT